MESSASRNIPYILNGELYEIQCQNGENVTVRCCNCPDRVYRGSVRSTGNFHMHIKRRHPELLPRLLEMKVNALLDRRDKHIKYRRRKSNQRNAQASIKQEQKALAKSTTVSIEQKSTTIVKCVQEVTSSEPPPLAMMATHKLKIKTAFQRHKLQQEAQAFAVAEAAAEVAELQQNNAIREVPHTANEPIDYSVKEIAQPTSEMDVQNNNSSSISSTTAAEVMTNNVSQQPPPLPNEIQQLQPTQQVHSDTVIGQPLQPPPMPLPNCPECNNATDIVTSAESGCVDGRAFPMAIVKHENITEQALDLSYQSSLTSTFSSPSTASTTHLCVEESRMFSAACRNERWSELLLQVESSLRDIQREMSTRNQIEVAKFKYLHPGFNFHC